MREGFAVYESIPRRGNVPQICGLSVKKKHSKIYFVQKKESLKNVNICVLNFAFIILIFHMTYAFRMYAGLCTQSTPPPSTCVLCTKLFTSAFIQPAHNSTLMCTCILLTNMRVHKTGIRTLSIQSSVFLLLYQHPDYCTYKPEGCSLLPAGLLH